MTLFRRVDIDRRFGVSIIAATIECGKLLLWYLTGFIGGGTFLSRIQDASVGNLLIILTTLVLLFACYALVTIVIVSQWSWSGLDLPWKICFLGYINIKAASSISGIMPINLQYALSIGAIAAAGLALFFGMWIQSRVMHETAL